jgi:GTP cyclohydrolase IA
MEAEVLALMRALEKKYGWRFTEEELRNTPARVRAMYDEWDAKHKYQKLTTFQPMKYGGMVVLTGIKIYAVCSHHLAPFFGTVSIGYIPKDKVYGASKLARIVAKHGYQAQTQERLTQEILDGLDADDAIVVIKARHLCMLMRGVQDENEEMRTASLKGAFEKPEVRAEFYTLAGWK